MEKGYNILLKVNMGTAYTFFNSGEKYSFCAGSKRCDIKLKGSGVEEQNFWFDYRPDNKSWYVTDVSAGRTGRFNKRSFGDKRIRIKEGDIVAICASNDKKCTPTIFLEVIKKINNKTKSKMASIPLKNKNEHIIGRAKTCDIIIDNPQVSEEHSKIFYDGSDCYIEDLHSLSGTYVNNTKVKRALLRNYDRISLTGGAFIFYENSLLHSKSADGIEITADHVEKTVYSKRDRSMIKLVDDISMTVEAGSFVAVVGGSGAGKSTFVDCLNGMRPATSGKILYDGNDYYENINSYRGVVGIVPQRDIMHEDIPLFQALKYTANLRMRNALRAQELERHVQNIITDVRLNGKEDLRISLLSGGQKKRVSIAMELLAEPKALFLDEPTSGLSPDLDFELMDLLKELASKGRTIIIITHSMENIQLCDKIAVLGKGGRLCFYGTPKEVFGYFGCAGWAEIFGILTDEETAEHFKEKYDSMREPDTDNEATERLAIRSEENESKDTTAEIKKAMANDKKATGKDKETKGSAADIKTKRKNQSGQKEKPNIENK